MCPQGLFTRGSQVSPPLCRRWQLFGSQSSLPLFFAWLPGISSAYAQQSIKQKTQVGPRRISGAPGSFSASLPPIRGSAHKLRPPGLPEPQICPLGSVRPSRSAWVYLSEESRQLWGSPHLLLSPRNHGLLLSSLKQWLLVVFVQVWWEQLHGQNVGNISNSQLETDTCI